MLFASATGNHNANTSPPPPNIPMISTNNKSCMMRRTRSQSRRDSSRSPDSVASANVVGRGGDGGTIMGAKSVFQTASKALPPNTVSSTASGSVSKASRLRTVLFPIQNDEMKKFLLIGSIKFFVILALTLTRDNKDTMVVTECGAEAIAFLKVSHPWSCRLQF
eukprot:scaffold14541_cov207-Alexandrium_tamarense.AAC.3